MPKGIQSIAFFDETENKDQLHMYVHCSYIAICMYIILKKIIGNCCASCPKWNKYKPS